MSELVSPHWTTPIPLFHKHSSLMCDKTAQSPPALDSEVHGMIEYKASKSARLRVNVSSSLKDWSPATIGSGRPS